MRKTRIQYHRKKQGRTNYKKRLSLLKSRKNRLVIRKTNKYIIAQIVAYEPAGDKVLVGVNSKSLKKIGWNNSGKNLPGCYLTGLLLGSAAKEKKISEVVLDLGLQTPINKSRLYAVLKGVVDAGIKVPHGEEIFPEENRLTGKHISEKISKDFEATKAKIKI